jgi:hypothetical protein
MENIIAKPTTTDAEKIAVVPNEPTPEIVPNTKVVTEVSTPAPVSEAGPPAKPALSSPSEVENSSESVASSPASPSARTRESGPVSVPDPGRKPNVSASP